MLTRQYSVQFLILILTVALFLAGCRRTPDTGQMARDMCHCMQPLVELYASMEWSADAGEGLAMDDLMKEVDDQAARTENCINDLIDKYGPALDEEDAAISAAMKKICPEVAQVFGEMELGER